MEAADASQPHPGHTAGVKGGMLTAQSGCSLHTQLDSNLFLLGRSGVRVQPQGP